VVPENGGCLVGVLKPGANLMSWGCFLTTFFFFFPKLFQENKVFPPGLLGGGVSPPPQFNPLFLGHPSFPGFLLWGFQLGGPPLFSFLSGGIFVLFFLGIYLSPLADRGKVPTPSHPFVPFFAFWSLEGGVNPVTLFPQQLPLGFPPPGFSFAWVSMPVFFPWGAVVGGGGTFFLWEILDFGVFHFRHTFPAAPQKKKPDFWLVFLLF